MRSLLDIHVIGKTRQGAGLFTYIYQC